MEIINQIQSLKVVKHSKQVQEVVEEAEEEISDFSHEQEIDSGISCVVLIKAAAVVVEEDTIIHLQTLQISMAPQQVVTVLQPPLHLQQKEQQTLLHRILPHLPQILQLLMPPQEMPHKITTQIILAQHFKDSQVNLNTVPSVSTLQQTNSNTIKFLNHPQVTSKEEEVNKVSSRIKLGSLIKIAILLVINKQILQVSFNHNTTAINLLPK